MYKIRQIKYSANSVSIQVYQIINRKRVIIRHIGTARNDQEKSDLIKLAQDFIYKTSKQLSFFEDTQANDLLHGNHFEFIGVYYSFLHEILSKILFHIGYDKIRSALLLDLVIIRIIEPASKLHSFELLNQYFGIRHRRQSYYENAKEWLLLKPKIESITVKFAKKQFGFSYDILFYDVTTLYFETFEEDDLRKNGFSKDNKSQQPQNNKINQEEQIKKHMNSQYNQVICKICFNNNTKSSETNVNSQNPDSFIILSCNHTFHIKCLAEIQFNDMYKFHVIDSEYFKTRKCMVCTKTLEIEELLFLHSKFLSNTKSLIDSHDCSIKNLENKLKNLKDELRQSYEYRNKLHHEREKSKEMVSNLTMMI
jgi:hypothetical protein